MNNNYLNLNKVSETMDADGREHILSTLEDRNGVSQFIIDAVIDNGLVHGLVMIPVGDGSLALKLDDPLYGNQTTITFSKETCRLVSLK